MPKEKKRRKSGFYYGMILIAVVLVLFVIYYKAMIPVEYRIFTQERIDKLEEEYNIDLSDAEPKRYWVVSIAQDACDCFAFCVDDYKDFMENCYFGEIISTNESDDKSYAEYKCKPYSENEDEKKSEFVFFIKFEINGDKYDADLTSYYE